MKYLTFIRSSESYEEAGKPKNAVQILEPVFTGKVHDYALSD